MLHTYNSTQLQTIIPSAIPRYPNVIEGDIMKAKPKHFVPRPEGVGSVGQHPVIVLTRPDAHGYALVTPMSHSHPDGTPTRSASRYGLPVDPLKGESRVNIGQPKVIHQDNLKANNPHVAMPYGSFLALRSDICEFFMDEFCNGKGAYLRLGR